MSEGTGSPLLSVITISLNSAKFLRETLDSVARQTFEDFEHIVVDGASTDGTQAILAEYPSVRWISEPDGEFGALAAIHKAVAMARGKYVIQCCVSDGFLDSRWFARAVAYLEAHPECALVWSFPQLMAEDGALLGLFHADLLERPPRNGLGFLPFWAASQFVFPEGNYCTYREIWREAFPRPGSPEHHIVQPHLGFVFNFMRRGYLPAVIPQVTSYFRLHDGQRYQRRRAIELPAARRYQWDVFALWRAIVFGREPYAFRDPHGRPLKQIGLEDRMRLVTETSLQRLLRVKVLRYPPIHVLRYLCRIMRGGESSNP